MGKIRQSLKKILGVNNGQTPQERNLLNEVYGHNLSKDSGKPIYKDGSPIPWYTYAGIQFIEQFDLSGKSVFEWGCGNSSLFFAARAAKVISVEHDNKWYQQMKPVLKQNQQLKYVSLEEYPASIKDFSQKFDIIVIDGQRRFDCTKEVLPFLADDGMIILDNSDWFYVSAALLREKYGLIQADFHGFGPINDYPWTTSVFFTRQFKFPLKEGRMPSFAMGGLTHDEMEIISSEDARFNTRNHEWVKRRFQ